MAVLSTLVALGFAALLAGRVVVDLIEARLIAASGSSGARAAAPLEPPRRYAPLADLQTITERNIFCSFCQESPAEPGARPLPRRFTLHGLELLATLVHPEKPAASVALVRAARATRLITTGCRVGGGRVVRVVSDRVTIQRKSATAELTFFEARSSRPQPRSQQTEAVRRLGPDSYQVKRDLIRRLLLNPGPLERDGRVRFRPGAAAIEVQRVRPGGLYDRLGLRTGDRIRAVDGTPLTDLDRLIGLFGRLDTLDRLRITIRRGSRSRTLTYRLR